MRIRREARISKLKQVHTYVPCEDSFSLKKYPRPQLKISLRRASNCLESKEALRATEHLECGAWATTKNRPLLDPDIAARKLIELPMPLSPFRTA